MGRGLVGASVSQQTQIVTKDNFRSNQVIVNSTITDIIEPVTPNYSHTVTETELTMAENIVGLNPITWNFNMSTPIEKTAVTTFSDNLTVLVKVNDIDVDTRTLNVSDGSKYARHHYSTRLTELSVGDKIEIFIWSTAGASIFQYTGTKIWFIPKKFQVSALAVSFLVEEVEQTDSAFADLEDFVAFESLSPSYSDISMSYGIFGDTGSGGIWNVGLMVMKGQTIENTSYSTNSSALQSSSGLFILKPNINNIKFVHTLT